MTHDDFAFEPVRGLPGRLPPGEEILWQGSPQTLALLRDALAINWVIGWFALLAVWRVGVSSAEMSLPAALATALPLVVAGAGAVGLLYLFARAQARATVYTITTHRVAMRIGAALQVTLNLPFSKIGNANLALHGDGTGTIALQTMGDDRIAYLVAWPHVRPWRMAQTEPALRSIADAEAVAAILAEAAETRLNAPVIARAAPPPQAVAAE